MATARIIGAANESGLRPVLAMEPVESVANITETEEGVIPTDVIQAATIHWATQTVAVLVYPLLSFNPSATLRLGGQLPMIAVGDLRPLVMHLVAFHLQRLNPIVTIHLLVVGLPLIAVEDHHRRIILPAVYLRRI